MSKFVKILVLVARMKLYLLKEMIMAVEKI
ncbi:hypothetical protein O97_00727 [Bartonella henselae str. Zeus]|nr:hypothetical protein O97_00727 [Bartonella henselae str. Zeus]KEC62986.1 hypothetical protein O95_00595 [Bartonella henselae JK 53]